ncbi:hypothetical protein RJT34_33096 [Clitoria ternatea]|uniref:Pectinesterase inhibitor domain-containing protein n=1 Tax=Clitoria ternatea TaxID=43366 RepID=A0AAN9EY59_CLITE
MQTQPNNALSLTLLAFFLILVSPPRATAARPPGDLLRSSCAKARYPALCVQTLSTNANPTMKPLDMAQTAVKVSLAHARTLSVYLKTLKLPSGLSKRDRVAMSDCVQQVSDSVVELNDTLNELQHLRLGTFQWQMSNAQTWASAALTNGNTCLDGFHAGATANGNLKLDVKRRVTDVAMLTSNALYLINRLSDSSSNSKKPRVDFKN